MCGRYSITTPMEAMAGIFAPGATALPDAVPRFNVAPTQSVPIVRAREGAREMASVRWGLVPYWAEEVKSGFINARAESVAQKPSFRSAFLRRRCLVLADGFFEWQRAGQPRPVPNYIHPAEGGPFAMAGICDVRHGADGSRLESMAIISTAANDAMMPIHHRCPAVLMPDQWDTWLDTQHTSAREALTLLEPVADGFFTWHAVGDGVNRVANDDPALIAPRSGAKHEAEAAPRAESAPDVPAPASQLSLF